MSEAYDPGIPRWQRDYVTFLRVRRPDCPGERVFDSVLRMRRCSECKRDFEPSSRHRRCPACRSRDVCACGRPKQAKSATCSDCRPTGGPTNGRWSGGRTRHKAGYIMVHSPDHPRATSSPYVFEHILVMEALLGRHLEGDETVHHRNGVRDDNRPENLELWVRPQPSGIRAEDAVAWAREILDRYEGTTFTSNNARDPQGS